jgi:hypothetical protein
LNKEHKMLAANVLKELIDNGRVVQKSNSALRGDPKLGVLGELPGVWSNTEGFEGHGWNMIALPFGAPDSFGDFRLLLNQANETLDFDLIDLGVQNRGANRHDQHLSALRYLQSLDQVAAIDATHDETGAVVVPATPDTNDTPKGAHLLPGPGIPADSPVAIHREPGVFLHLANLPGPHSNPFQPGPDLGRLASIPHGDVVLAMGFNGSGKPTSGPPNLNTSAITEAFDPLPIGLADNSLSQAYLSPYAFFNKTPFKTVFNPTDPLGVLRGAIQQKIQGATIVETTTFTVDSQTSSGSGGILNIPFVVNQANSTRITATFWIQKVQTAAATRFVLQYAQRVLLEFSQRGDGKPGLVQWPHISVNTLIRQLD